MISRSPRGGRHPSRPSAAAAIPGAYIGSHLTGRLDEHALIRVMAAILFITGLSMLAQAIVG